MKCHKAAVLIDCYSCCWLYSEHSSNQKVQKGLIKADNLTAVVVRYWFSILAETNLTTA